MIRTGDRKRQEAKERQTKAIESGRVPPHAADAEMAILGCVLLDSSIMADLTDVLHSADMFYDLRHRVIWVAMVALSAKSDRVDTVGLVQRLKDRGELQEVGGVSFLSELPDRTPTAENWAYYADILKEKWARRKAIVSLSSTVSVLYDEGKTLEEVMDATEGALLAASTRKTQSNIRSMGSFVAPVMEDLDTWYSNGGGIQGLATGFEALDRIMCGMRPSELIVFGARPSVGKTAQGMNIMFHVASQGIPVGVFSLEMSGKALTQRVISTVAEVNLRETVKEEHRDETVGRLAAAAAEVRKLPIFIDDSRGMNATQLRIRARRMLKAHGIQALLVDYLQLIQSGGGNKFRNRQAELSEVIGDLKSLAMELDIPILVLSQLSRELEKDNRRPVMSDLKETGAIEQDADVIVLWWRPDAMNKRRVSGVVAKQRNGATGTVDLSFTPEWTKFEDYREEKVAFEDESEIPFPT